MDTLKDIDFRLLIEQLPAIVWATDRDLRFLYSRGAGLAALGLTADEVVGLPLSDYLGTRDPDHPMLTAHRAVLEGVPAVDELRHEGRVYRVHLEPWRAGSAGIVGVLGVALDITDRRQMEEAHRQADLLHHVGSLAHAAAHEINNPLAVIYGQIDLIARTAGPELRPRLDACREAITRIADILDRMQSLARLELSQGWPADLPAMLDLKASSAAPARGNGSAAA